MLKKMKKTGNDPNTEQRIQGIPTNAIIVDILWFKILNGGTRKA